MRKIRELQSTFQLQRNMGKHGYDYDEVIVDDDGNIWEPLLDCFGRVYTRS